MERLELLLRQSIDEYRRMGELMEDLAADLGTADAVAARAELLEAMLGSAAQTDGTLAAELAVEAPPRLLPLMRERFELLQRLEEENRRLMPRLQAMLAVTAADLAELRQGRTALSGYHSGVAATGRRIDSC